MLPVAMLTDAERATYEWQMWVPGFGETGQQNLKASTVLISRCGGVGGAVALQLAAAGVGRLVLAHAGNLKPADLNRQVLMRADALGTSRVECAARTLRALNERVEVVPVAENISETNAERLIRDVDLVVDCAPLFNERRAMNQAVVAFRKPMVECAMFDLELQVTSILPGRTPCLTCLYPDPPQDWKREFPVFGAVSGTAGSLGAMEAIKILSGLGQPLYGRLLTGDLRQMTFRTLRLRRDPKCAVCGHLP